MSWLSNGLAKVGISKDVQRGALTSVATATLGPMGGAAVAAAQRATATIRSLTPPKISGVDWIKSIPSQLGASPGTAVAVAHAASRLPNPFAGVVRPGTDPMSRALGLGPGGSLGGHSMSMRSDQPLSGYHLNKHKLADGTPARSVYVRNRHMNPANGRAIRRAASRLKSAEKLFRKVLTLRHGHVKGSVVPKHGRKR